jgi:hypothetical protein
MDVRKAKRKSASKRVAMPEIYEKELQLLLELRDLLRNFGPPWYTEELDARLDKVLAPSNSLKS